MKAILKNFRQSPKKVRLVSKAIVNKSVKNALNILLSLDKKVSIPLYKLIMSAVSNSKDKKIDDLKIKNISVDQGITLKRYRPRAFGKASPIKKRRSTINLELK